MLLEVIFGFINKTGLSKKGNLRLFSSAEMISN
jgi:hypothetical protein